MVHRTVETYNLTDEPIWAAQNFRKGCIEHGFRRKGTIDGALLGLRLEVERVGGDHCSDRNGDQAHDCQ